MRSGIRNIRLAFFVAALLVAATTQFDKAAAQLGSPPSVEERSSDTAMGFIAVGGESGLGLSEVLKQLATSETVRLRREVVKAQQAPIAAVRASYGLPAWVDLSGLMDFLCEYNRGVCSRTKGETVWRVQAGGLADVPSFACGGSRQPNAPPTFICIPDVTMSAGTTFTSRVFGSSREAAAIPSIIASNTKGCATFDIYCQRLILGRNSTQTAAWKSAQAAGLYGESPDALKILPWWTELSGRVVLPTAFISAVLPRAATSPSQEKTCDAIEKAVKDADKEIRAKRQLKEWSYIVATDCTTVLINRASAASQARGIQSHALVTPQFRNELMDRFHRTMNLETFGGPTSGHPMIGVWDGIIESGLDLLRESFPALTNNKVSWGDYSLGDNTVVSWVDLFPTKFFDKPSGGPCGEIRLDSHEADHGTVVASIIAGLKGGLLPGARLWAHQWDRRRFEFGREFGPQDSMSWFNKNVAESRFLGLSPHVFNLSCGVAYTVRDEEDSWQSLKAHLIGPKVDAIVRAPYVGAVAAGNRRYNQDPAFVAMPAPGSITVGLGGGGFPFLARQYQTAGFISVVGLSLNGGSALQCRDIQELLEEIASLNANRTDPTKSGVGDGVAGAGESRITDFCPISRTSDPDAARIPLVVSGKAFDVGAVGIGVGITQAEDGPVVMWGSSFAAPYVTALAGELVEKIAKKAPDQPPPEANLVADRIRFTADRIGDIVLYGRINGRRALSFETDQFEWSQEADGSSFIKDCIDHSGQVGLDSDNKSRSMALSLSDNTLLKLDDVLRLRATDEANIYEVMYRNSKYQFGPSVIVATLPSGAVQLPVQCAGRPDKPKYAGSVQLQALQSFTRCSFGVGGCK